MSEIDPITKLIQDARLIICAGPGGVGKTTTSAAMGMQAALEGRKVIVLTIDPARRLANSLGLDELTNEPQQIDLHEAGEVEFATEEPGELWAMMLDQQQTLDDLIAKYAPDKGALERSRQNNIYKLLSGALHGMQEYMALDKLHDLYTGGYFDLVVLDTPPTKNALEFLETPSRARRFFDDRIMKWFIPSKADNPGFFSRVFDPGAVVLGLLGKVFGENFVQDLVDFFDTLSFLQEALRSRGEMIDFILRDQGTAFTIITSADTRRIKEALFFHEKLSELDQEASAFVLNRVIPRFQESDLEELDRSALADDFAAEGSEESDALVEAIVDHYGQLAGLSKHNRAMIDGFTSKVAPHPVRSIPLFGEDVHSVEQLLKLGAYLRGQI